MKQVRGQGLSFTASDELIENARNAGADSDLANELKGASQTAVTANSPEADAVRGMVQAAIAIKRGEYRGAQHQIRTLLRADSQNPDLYFALGNAYQQMQDWDNAGEAYTRAIQLEPDFAYANGQLSFMYYKIGDSRGARSAAETMIRLAPESGDAHKFLGLSMERAGDYDGALQEFTKAITLEPKSAATYYYDIGVVRTDQKEWSAAIAAYQSAIQVGPTQWPFYNNLGIALGRMNRVDEAGVAFEKGKALAPSEPGLRQSYGALLCNCGRYEAAVKEFRDLLELMPEWNMARPCLYRSLIRTGHRDEAQKVKEDYAAYSPDHTSW